MGQAKTLAKYKDDGGREIVLTDVDLVRVISDNTNVTPREMKLFVELCKAQRLNPFIKEAYLVKYGDSPATIVVGKDVFTKRAARNPRFRGYEAGLSIMTRDGRMVRREGSMTLKGEQVVGGWCRVHIDGYETPMFDEVGFDEYAGRKRDGSLNNTWASKPNTMIRKTAIVHALREAFPADFQGMYDGAEMGIEVPAGAEDPVEPTAAEEPEEAEAVEVEDAGNAHVDDGSEEREYEMREF